MVFLTVSSILFVFYFDSYIYITSEDSLDKIQMHFGKVRQFREADRAEAARPEGLEWMGILESQTGLWPVPILQIGALRGQPPGPHVQGEKEVRADEVRLCGSCWQSMGVGGWERVRPHGLDLKDPWGIARPRGTLSLSGLSLEGLRGL